MKNISKSWLTSIFLGIVIVFLSISCSKQEQEPKKDIVQQFDTLLNNEHIRYLENTIDFMEYFTYLKKIEVPYKDLVAKPEQYEKSTDRRNKVIRFGMLCSDIAYMKIVGGLTQTPEYDKLFERYIKDLNLSAIMKNSFEEYKSIVQKKGLSEELFEDLRKKLRLDRVAFVNEAKKLDDVFLIYFTIGNVIEQFYLLESLKNDSQSKEKIKKINEYIKANGAPVPNLFNDIWNSQFKDASHQICHEYVLKLKPVYQIMLNKIMDKTDYTDEELLFISKKTSELRSEFLK
ncbi:MAG TPA: hypothetical protein PKY56_05935 [Candidatus Kapabacteria bacterium]|nr:hypothetical protein [Candidatus Kapabacteria bacterium]HPO63822.1 hypothetical protein [Candidatus Kapabacteria bacterium]